MVLGEVNPMLSGTLCPSVGTQILSLVTVSGLLGRYAFPRWSVGTSNAYSITPGAFLRTYLSAVRFVTTVSVIGFGSL